MATKEDTAWGVSFTTSTGSPGIDAWGNVFQTSSISGTSINPMSMTQVIGDNNRFTVNGYGYDAAGNVLNDGITTGCGTYGYTWNAEEQMTCAAGSTYTYDGDGIRVEKTGGNATPTMYWGAGNLAESNTSGTLTSEYIFAGGKRIARRDIATGSVYYYFTDMLGSSSVLATSSGGVENESDYEPYGGEANVTQSLTNQHYKFEGKERDPETGLDNFGARFSNPNMGRFMSPDWANKPEPVPYAKLTSPQTLNLYAFAGNNPESAPDLDGHFATRPWDDWWTGGESSIRNGQQSYDVAPAVNWPSQGVGFQNAGPGCILCEGAPAAPSGQKGADGIANKANTAAGAIKDGYGIAEELTGEMKEAAHWHSLMQKAFDNSNAPNTFTGVEEERYYYFSVFEYAQSEAIYHGLRAGLTMLQIEEGTFTQPVGGFVKFMHQLTTASMQQSALKTAQSKRLQMIGAHEAFVQRLNEVYGPPVIVNPTQ